MDQAKAEKFAGRVLTALNEGALCLMLQLDRNAPAGARHSE